MAKKKELQIVDKNTINYTFNNTEFADVNSQKNNNNESNNKEQFILKKKIDSKKLHYQKRRITGGQTQQSHSSVYE